ncbi:hypothetical protein RJ639_030030 [Escallonia herrerae]|uniref:H15 domain-containing protein n=1 Tax=Escallonia herrerae TaxID=1293975 RepID=A0AA88WYL2_9ASTE|nr:hypothetical protein RJ639_030030 [Escallonia herrerae]
MLGLGLEVRVRVRVRAQISYGFLVEKKEGSNKSSISQYIESTYGDLPAGHANLLSDNLNKMKEAGELAMVKNNYLRSDPSAPPKRGRGRPPKAQDPWSPEAAASSLPPGLQGAGAGRERTPMSR